MDRTDVLTAQTVDVAVPGAWKAFFAQTARTFVAVQAFNVLFGPLKLFPEPTTLWQLLVYAFSYIALSVAVWMVGKHVVTITFFGWAPWLAMRRQGPDTVPDLLVQSFERVRPSWLGDFLQVLAAFTALTIAFAIGLGVFLVKVKLGF